MRGLLAALAAFVLLVLLAPTTARAGGAVFGRAAPAAAGAEADPDGGAVRATAQRALLRWDPETKTETLVIETLVRGPGADFAWILPLPAAPEIEPSTPGLFPTLRALSPVKCWVEVRPWWLVLLAAVGLIHWRRRLLEPAVAIIAILVCAVIYGLLVALGPGHSVWLMSGGGRPDGFMQLPVDYGEDVSDHDREAVGEWDATVLRPSEPSEVRRWLSDNGYAAPERIDAVVDAYLREGWVFVAVKVRAPESADEVRRLRPLAFTFRTNEAVYPVRLAGATNDALDVELYVFGDRKGATPALLVTHCSEFGRREDDLSIHSWTHHPEIVRRVGAAAGVTRLVGRLEPSAMPSDVTFQWSSFRTRQPLRVTRAAAASAAVNAASLVLFLGWLLIRWRASRSGARGPWPRVIVLAIAAAVGGGVWVRLPKLPAGVPAPLSVFAVEYLKVTRYVSKRKHRRADFWSEVEAGPAFSDAAKARTWLRNLAAKHPDPEDGAVRREEDSPWNYVVEERDGCVFVGQYGACGPSGDPTDLSSFDRRSLPDDEVFVEGTLRDVRGEPVPDVEVIVQRAAPREAESPPRRDQRSSVSGDDGRFRVTVPKGFLCDVTVLPPRHVLVIRRNVDLRTDRPERLDLVLEDAPIVTGRVTDDGGAPLADAEISLPSRLTPDTSRTVPVAPDGTFAIALATRDAGPTSVTVHVHRKDVECPRAEFTLTPGSAPRDLAVHLRPKPPDAK